MTLGRWLCLSLALGSLLALGACAASVPTASVSVLADLPTESDESAQRRRARLRFELSAGYLQEGQPQVALDEVKQAITLDPQFADALNLRGLIYLRLNNPALAADSFERALALQPRDANAAHNLGLLRCQQSRFAEADIHFAKAAANSEYAQQARNWVAQGLCQASAGQVRHAEASLLRALTLDANDAAATYHLARLLFQRGDALAAQAHVLKLNSSAAVSAPSLWLGIRIERQLGKPDAIRALAEQLRAGFGQSPELSAFDRGAFHE